MLAHLIEVAGSHGGRQWSSYPKGASITRAFFKTLSSLILGALKMSIIDLF